MKKTIEANEMSVMRLFSVGNEQFIVPVYQRRYLWGKDQWMDLWNDIQNIEVGEDHFLGSIVVINPQHNIEINQFEVVDGQQRLTTLSLLIAALRDSLIQHGGEQELSIGEALHGYMHCSTMFNKNLPKLIPGKLDRDDFATIIDRKIRDLINSNMYSAYQFFKAQFSEQNDLVEIAKTIIGSLKVVLIQVMSHKDAFRLFETLNDRGLSLSAADLIKNYILSKAARTSEDELDAIVETWDEIVELVGQLDHLRFFRQVLLSKAEGVFSFNKLYDRYKTLVDNTNSIVELVDELKEYAVVYSQICTATTKYPSVNEKLKAINAIGAATSYTLLLKLLKNKVDDQQVVTVLNLIETFALRRAICSWSTNNLDPIFNQLAINTPVDESCVEYVKGILTRTDYIPSDMDFIANFKSKNFRQDDQCKYILERFEDYHVNFSKEKIIANRSLVHIEHIMPKTIKSKSSKKEYGDWESYLGKDSHQHDVHVNKIGNLTLLGSNLNISASNNPFEEKKKNYEKSSILMTKQLTDYSKWDITSIEERTEKLAGIAAGIWKL
ncbi:hypothetical protein A8708_31350 [Paenibacillus oryzisoli]|uniref:DUF262 domain-containing protein n=1 Tax=Paenibacillus oryzisoli TaxID=1850517 RepID=A0A198AJW0_9BACL|nr:hypothetical protein A8708_31350 [Paenibacillus oryzisoli]